VNGYEIINLIQKHPRGNPISMRVPCSVIDSIREQIDTEGFQGTVLSFEDQSQGLTDKMLPGVLSRYGFGSLSKPDRGK